MMSRKWRDEQAPSYIDSVSSFLSENSFDLEFVSIDPDLIFNCEGLSVAFVFVTNWDCGNPELVFNRVQKLEARFKNLYVVVCLPTKEKKDSFQRSYFKFEREIGGPVTFVPIQGLEMGFEKMIKIALSGGGK
ncbi:unnamed protein product [Linum tenue]|uniref:Uncharacterized protein n=1 Tax=Linum tenue TaxID=586396 RepID=A0AAV0RI69_9ROSI|nr:unnamed protein product [Linum tenue]